MRFFCRKNDLCDSSGKFLRVSCHPETSDFLGLWVVWSTPFEGEQNCWSGSTFRCFCQIFRQILADSQQYLCGLAPYVTTFLYLYLYLRNKSKQIHSVFWLPRAISGHIFVFVFVFAKQIQADPLSILAASCYIRPHLLPTRVTAREQLPPKLPWTLVALVSTKIPKKIQVKYQVPKDTSKIPPIRVIGSTVSTASRMISFNWYAWYRWVPLKFLHANPHELATKLHQVSVCWSKVTTW